MDAFEFYPAKTSLKKSIAFGLFYLLLAWIYRSIVDFADIGSIGTAVLVVFVVIGAHGLLRGLIGLAAPKPCFAADGSGFSVRGKKRWRWDELVDVRIRRVRAGPIPVGTWVSLAVKKNGRGLTKRVEIPWSLLPGCADETAAAILQAALMAGWQPKDKHAARTAAKLQNHLAPG